MNHESGVLFMRNDYLWSTCLKILDVKDERVQCHWLIVQGIRLYLFSCHECLERVPQCPAQIH